MSVEIVVSLNDSWVLDHRDDDLLPIDFLKKEIKEKLQDLVTVGYSSLTELSLHLKDEKGKGDEVAKKILAIFSKRYGTDVKDDIISFKVDNVEETARRKEDTAGRFAAKEEPDSSVDCMEKIDALVGAEEFKALARELKQIAPQINRNKTYDTLLSQSYVFSINEGYGLSTSLSLLTELFASFKLGAIKIQKEALEIKLPPPKEGESMEPFSEAINNLSFGNKEKVKLLCVDISEWMNKTNSRVFKNFLSRIEKHASEFIVVFRIPYVDKDVLERVKFSISDLMFVKAVSFPPFSRGETQRCAEAEFEKYGFNMSDAAWEGFHARIEEERSDGKFYGVNTIKKVVRELLYKKQLDNALRGLNETIINNEDALELCRAAEDSGLSGYEMLDKLVGTDAIKQRINEIIAQIEYSLNDEDIQSPCVHMRFVGNPGTGKTTVARIIGKILKEKGVLRIGNFYEVSGRDFCGRYIGETAPKTAAICREAYGSVLFIDEAYSLYRGQEDTRDFGIEALDTLIAEMENHRSDMVVIMAGYTDEIATLMKGNAGLESRMPYLLEFPNFTREQLYEIYVSMLGNKTRYEEDLLPAVKKYFDELPQHILDDRKFSNARFVRNLYERTRAKASTRCKLEGKKTIAITKGDFELASSDVEFTFIMEKKNKIGFLN